MKYLQANENEYIRNKYNFLRAIKVLKIHCFLNSKLTIDNFCLLKICFTYKNFL